MVLNAAKFQGYRFTNSAEILSSNKKAGREQDSKIDSINGSGYFNKTSNVDGKWYIFKNICFEYWLDWVLYVCIDACPILLLYIFLLLLLLTLFNVEIKILAIIQK